MEFIEVVENLLRILLWLRDFLAMSISSYVPHDIAMQIATVIYMLLPTSAVYIALRLFNRNTIDKIVFYTLTSLWILVGTVVVLAKVLFS